jgi:hypothetical protein
VTLTIICLAQAEGRVHDFQLFKDDIGDSIGDDILLKCDSGYQGIEGLHANSRIPIKKPRGGELLELKKAYNRRLARERVAIEHVNRTIKTFRILKDKYRKVPYSHDAHLRYHKLRIGTTKRLEKRSILGDCDPAVALHFTAGYAHLALRA